MLAFRGGGADPAQKGRWMPGLARGQRNESRDRERGHGAERHQDRGRERIEVAREAGGGHRGRFEDGIDARAFKTTHSSEL
jgi:hypothetical protein